MKTILYIKKYDIIYIYIYIYIYIKYIYVCFCVCVYYYEEPENRFITYISIKYYS